MLLSFEHNGFQYDAVDVSTGSIPKNIVCIDTVMFNEHSPTRTRYSAPPVGTRSAWQRVMFPEFVTKKDLEKANQFLDSLVENSAGLFIPDINQRWFRLIESVMNQKKSIYTTLSSQRGKACAMHRFMIH